MKKLLPISIAFALLCSTPVRAARLKDLASIEGVRDNHLVGYGLVVGLAGKGVQPAHAASLIGAPPPQCPPCVMSK